jgi:hypothetical protein
MFPRHTQRFYLDQNRFGVCVIGGEASALQPRGASLCVQTVAEAGIL